MSLNSKPIAWSYSVLNGFETCAWRFYQITVLKAVQEQQSEQMLHGNRVHKALEVRVKSKIPLPRDMDRFEPMVRRLEASAVGGKIEAEQRMALDASFKPVSFFSKTTPVWVRGITDVTIEKGEAAFIGDYKTGKPTPESAQLRLTAAMTFAHKPHIRKITNAFIWLQGDNTPPTVEHFVRSDVPAIWQEFLPRVARLEEAHVTDRWPKKPSGLCRNHCPVPHSKCEHRG